ncbi:hypothetical protein DWU98_14645 [Dyella monticola]|uniref:Uncharacterized protein n=1 Tax=Dyella monticola TaxID=1927958 RepID=A0A370WVH0_9GAMM|nr:hypothetical protein [Dyella monticola]RDS80148.1 hypothetical protein DWU98_14645 [Dyella monticola]
MPRTLDPLIESFLPELHATRWTQKALDIQARIRAEEAQPYPDADTLASLRAELQTWTAQRFNVESTRQSLIDATD